MTDLQLEVARRLGRDRGEGDLNSASDQVLDGIEFNVIKTLYFEVDTLYVS